MLSFDKSARLRKRIEFTALAVSGRKVYLPNFIIVNAASDFSWPRIGITASKKVGNSVCRNRIKRLIREFFRNNRDLFLSADYNIIARSGSVNLGYGAVCQELTNGLCRIDQQNNR
jgi:ribonuclease P protein component